MKNEIEKAIKLLAQKINTSHKEVTPDEALKYSQAALNLAHTASVLEHIHIL